MSEQHHDFPKTTVSQVILAVLGGLFAPALVIFLVVKLLLGIQASHIEDADPALNAAKVEERIKPVASVAVADTSSGPHVDKSGEEVVTAVCSACHGSGALGSPKIGDKAAWGPRIAQGYEALIKHAMEGIRQMPARGGNPDLTDGEIANAVAFMANQGGAKFTPPTSAGKAAVAEPEPAKTDAAKTEAAKPVAAKTEAAKPVAAKSDVAKTESAKQEAPAKVANGGAAKSSDKSGEQVVTAVCSACHASGALGAPKIGDKAAWAPRIAQGYETLIKHAMEGVRMMPARGGNPDLTNGEIANAVAYMANQGGANFTPPAAQ
jgi:cytochrome c5